VRFLYSQLVLKQNLLLFFRQIAFCTCFFEILLKIHSKNKDPALIVSKKNFFFFFIIIISGGPSPGGYPKRKASGTIKSRYATSPHHLMTKALINQSALVVGKSQRPGTLLEVPGL
jgi:hypothetical protein